MRKIEKTDIFNIISLVVKYLDDKQCSDKLPDSLKLEVQTWLKDFQVSRTQIQHYQKMQYNLIWLVTSVVAAILTTAVALSSSSIPMEYFLPAISLISGLLGICWVTIGIKTTTVSDYIRRKISPQLKVLCQNDDVMGLENYFRETTYGTRKLNMISLLAVPTAVPGLIFVLFCVAGLFISKNVVISSSESGIVALWWISLVVTIFLILYGLVLGIYFILKLVLR